MPNFDRLRLVDTAARPSVSFARPDPTAVGLRGEPESARVPIAVGPGRAQIATTGRVRVHAGDDVSGYPIQPGKVQLPALRDETLARTRLLEWLDVKIHGRVVFVIADAGYGKTTLLADFARRSRLRTIWYRLDENDRDWVGFLSHLIAAGRELDPEFAPRTSALLRSLEPGGATREDAIHSFLAELPSITNEGAVLVFDDFHLADDVTDIRLIAREFIARGPERLSIVFASRRPPALPVSRLRTLGELAELSMDDLRFSEAEMEELFRETYRRPLEPDVPAELARRTEGWAASLSLIQAALRERSPAETRAFVRGLSGARDELRDYLAEEIVGDLPLVHQRFLMRTSILQVITPELAQVATQLTASEVQSLLSESERLGLLGRRADRRPTGQRYHPLVREFLDGRLRRDIGEAGVAELHAAIARWAEPMDWLTSAHHYAACGARSDLQRVLEASIEHIVASGAFSVAAIYVDQGEPLAPSASIEVIRSRLASLTGDADTAMAHARRAAQLDADADTVINNLITSGYLTGDLNEALDLADRLATRGRSPLMRAVGEAVRSALRSSLDANLSSSIELMEAFAERSRASGHLHFEGVSLLNAALMLKAQGNGTRVLATSARAIDSLSGSSSGNELSAAYFAKAWGLALVGDVGGARELMRETGAKLRLASRTEYLAEHADLEAQLGDETIAMLLASEFASQASPGAFGEVSRLTRAHLLLRNHEYERAFQVASSADTTTPTPESGHKSRALALRGLAAVLADIPGAAGFANEAFRAADHQSADLWRVVAVLSEAAATDRIDAAVVGVEPSLATSLSIAAELIVDRLENLGGTARSLVAEEAAVRPERWRPALRWAISNPSRAGRLDAARLLDIVGDPTDVARLRGFVREQRRIGADRQLGRGLAKRLAPRVVVEDLGRVVVRIGPTEIGGGQVRRKVLALLCFLLTRPRFEATREEVMDAMWPEMDPDAAMNSLNQTIYFLRRVFEPTYDEDTSAGYVRQESDVVWLDAELIASRSSICAGLIAQHERDPRPETVDRLSLQYKGRFALDFAYEEWATDFRDWLHVAYLNAIEGAIQSDISTGHYHRGIGLVRRGLEVDPRLDAFEVSLVRLLKGAGAHSAAAEQYGRYAGIHREEAGTDPPPLESV